MVDSVQIAMLSDLTVESYVKILREELKLHMEEHIAPLAQQTEINRASISSRTCTGQRSGKVSDASEPVPNDRYSARSSKDNAEMGKRPSMRSNESSVDRVFNVQTTHSLDSVVSGEQILKKYFHSASMAVRSGSLTRHRIKEILTSHTEYFVSILIVVNALVFGVQLDYQLQNPQEEKDLNAFIAVEWAFTTIFTIEIACRLCYHKLFFFNIYNRDFGWNLLDTFLIIFAYSEIVFQTINAPNLAFARLLRILRIFRLLRLVRLLRFFTSLRVMLMGILGSLKPLLWAMSLLVFIIYNFAVLMLELMQEDIAELQEHAHFSSFGRLMLTMFMSISGGISWSDVIEPLLHINAVIAPIYSMYIAFSLFCVLNIVTGIFVEYSSRMTQEDEENLFINELDGRRQWLDKIRGIFEQAKTGKTLTYAGFLETISDMRMQVALKQCGIDVTKVDSMGIWNMIDYEKTGEIALNDFLGGLLKIRGEARSIDIEVLKREVIALRKKVQECMLGRSSAPEDDEKHDSIQGI